MELDILVAPPGGVILVSMEFDFRHGWSPHRRGDLSQALPAGTKDLVPAQAG